MKGYFFFWEFFLLYIKTDSSSFENHDYEIKKSHY